MAPGASGTGPATAPPLRSARAGGGATPARPSPAALRTASELRVVLGQLVRRLRSEHRFGLSHGAVLGRLDREGAQSVSDLAACERVRPQSMAQTVCDLERDDLVTRAPDPRDRRRALVELTAAGRAALAADRRQREGWLAEAIAALGPSEQEVLAEATALLRAISEG